MPRYEYRCSECGWSGDLIVRIEDRDDQECPGERPSRTSEERQIAEGNPGVFFPCEQRLHRPEISGNIAKMRLNWKV